MDAGDLTLTPSTSSPSNTGSASPSTVTLAQNSTFLCKLKTTEGAQPNQFHRKTIITLAEFNPGYRITVLAYHRPLDEPIEKMRTVHEFYFWPDEHPQYESSQNNEARPEYQWDYGGATSVNLDIGNRHVMRTAIIAQLRDDDVTNDGQMWGCSISGNNLRFLKVKSGNCTSVHTGWTGRLELVNGGVTFVFDQCPERDFEEEHLSPEETKIFKEYLDRPRP